MPKRILKCSDPRPLEVNLIAMKTLFLFLCTFLILGFNSFGQKYDYGRVVQIKHVGIASTVAGSMTFGMGSIMFFNATAENHKFENVGISLMAVGGASIVNGVCLWIISAKAQRKLDISQHRYSIRPIGRNYYYGKKAIPSFGISLSFSVNK